MSFVKSKFNQLIGIIRLNKIPYEGCVEHILPDRIIGWVSSKQIKIKEIKLLIGPHIIAKASVNLARKDVCKALNINENPGFVLRLPNNIPPLNKNLKIRLIATANQSDIALNSIQFNRPIADKKLLENILKSNILGIDGHFDGINDEKILCGWSAKKDFPDNKVSVWLNTKGLQPIELICNHYRGDKKEKNYCGFQIAIEKLPAQWIGRKVYCSFDKEGKFKLPQTKDEIHVTSNENVSIIEKDINKIEEERFNISYKKAPKELKEEWEDLKDFRVLLKELNEKLDELENKSRLELERVNKYPKIIRCIIKKYLKLKF